VSSGAATDGVALFFLEKKTDDLFSHRALPSGDFLALFSSPFPSSHVVYPVFFNVLSKSSHKNI